MSPGPRPKWRARALAGSPLEQTFLLSFPFPVRRSRRTRAWVCAFFPLPLKKKKKMPLCSPFFACPLEVLRDNITYVIYMHIKSFAGGCVCREFCARKQAAGLGGRVGRLRTAIHRKLAAVGGSVCVHMAGPPRFPALFGGAWGQGQEQESWGAGRRSGEACPARTKRASVFSCELALRWQLWALMSWCAKTRAVRLFGHFLSSLLKKKKKKKSWGVREGRSGEGIYLFSCDGDGTPSTPVVGSAVGQLQLPCW